MTMQERIPLVAHACMRIDRWLQTRRHVLVVSFALAVLVLAPALAVFHDDPRGVDDDWSISLMLSGRVGATTPCLFVNAVVSYISLGINALLPSVNGFYALEFVLSLLSMACLLAWALFWRHRLGPSIVASGTIFLTLTGVTIGSNFTYVAALCFIAGCATLISNAASARSVAPYPLGVILVMMGCALRWEIALLLVPACAIALVFVSRGVLSSSDHETHAMGSRLRPIAMALIGCLALAAFDLAIWQQPENREWSLYSSARSSAVDYTLRQYDDVRHELEPWGISETDYGLVQSWVFADPEVFDCDVLQVIGAQRAVQTPSVGRTILNAGAHLIESCRKLLMVMLVTCAAYVLDERRRGRATKAILLSMLCFAVLCCAEYAYVYSDGRVPDRVVTPLFLCAALGMTLSGLCERDVRQDARHSRNDGAPRAAMGMAALSVTCILVACLWGGTLLLPHASLQKLGHNLNQRSYVPQSAILSYERNHPDEVFAWDATGYAWGFEGAYGLDIIPDDDMLSRNFTLGGWAEGSPALKARRRRYGIDNLLKGLVDNPKVRLVTYDTSTADKLVAYLDEHYAADARYEVVDAIAGQTDDATAYIIRFYESG